MCMHVHVYINSTHNIMWCIKRYIHTFTHHIIYLYSYTPHTHTHFPHACKYLIKSVSVAKDDAKKGTQKNHPFIFIRGANWSGVTFLSWWITGIISCSNIFLAQSLRFFLFSSSKNSANSKSMVFHALSPLQPQLAALIFWKV